MLDHLSPPETRNPVTLTVPYSSSTDDTQDTMFDHGARMFKGMLRLNSNSPDLKGKV